MIAASRAQETETEFDDTPKIVVLGDSLVAGYQLPPGKSFPERLQEALDAKGILAKIIAAGVSGDTTSGGLARLAWSVPEGVDGVMLELGANDALRGLPPKNTRENLNAIITQLTDRGIKVLLIGTPAPPNMGEDYAKEFNPIYPTLADEFGLRLYPFFLDGVLTHPEKLLDDGIHPNAAGIEVVVGKIIPMVEKFIEDLRPSP
ncbi:MAG: arylesterase [Rhizobiaceae bacterium]